MKIESNFQQPIEKPSTFPHFDADALKRQKPLNAGDNYSGRFDEYTIKVNLKAVENPQPKDPIVLIPNTFEYIPEPIIDVGALGFTEEETAMVKDFILNMQQGIYSTRGTQGYRDFAYLGIAAAKTKRFASEHLSDQKGKLLIDAVNSRIDTIKHTECGSYDVVDNNAYTSNGVPCNKKLKDDIYNLFSNMDTSSQESYESSFQTAQKKYAELLTPYVSSMGYSGGRLSAFINVVMLRESENVFNGIYDLGFTIQVQQQKNSDTSG